MIERDSLNFSIGSINSKARKHSLKENIKPARQFTDTI